MLFPLLAEDTEGQQTIAHQSVELILSSLMAVQEAARVMHNLEDVYVCAGGGK